RLGKRQIQSAPSNNSMQASINAMRGCDKELVCKIVKSTVAMNGATICGPTTAIFQSAIVEASEPGGSKRHAYAQSAQRKIPQPIPATLTITGIKYNECSTLNMPTPTATIPPPKQTITRSSKRSAALATSVAPSAPTSVKSKMQIPAAVFGSVGYGCSSELRT